MTSRNWPIPPGVRTITANGYEMAYLEQGQGTPLVLVHGSLNDYRVWAFQMGPFGSQFRTVAVSLRHFYPDPRGGEGGDSSVRQHAKDLGAFIRNMDAGPVHLVGHSRGGAVSLIMASDNPGLLHSMVLADPAPLAGILPDTPEANKAARGRNDMVEAAVGRMEKGDVDGGLEIFVDGVTVPGNWRKMPESVKQVCRDNAGSLKNLVSDAQTAFTCADAAGIEMPVLVLTGEKSPRIYGIMIEALMPCLKNGRAETIPGASHAMNRENPAAFNAAVLGFLKNSKA